MAKKILAMFLALCMCVSILPVQARAEENTETTTEATVTTENGEGGNATIVVTIDKPAEGTTGETGNADVSTASAEGATPAAEGQAPAAGETPAAEDETPAAPVDGTVTETNITEDGLTEVTTTTTTTTTAENGDTTVTVTTEKTTDGTTEEGVTVDRDETYTEKTETVTDAEGTETSTSWIEDGTETKEWTEEVTPEDTNLPEVELELVPGETNTETVTETETTVTGDVPEGEDDPQYDYTETTTTVNREVAATTTDVTIEAVQGEVELTPVAPEFRENADGKFESGYYEDGTPKENIIPFVNDIAGYGWYLKWNSEEQKWDSVYWSDEGDYRYVGWGEESDIEIEKMENITYETDEEGNLVFDENGNAVIKEYDDETTLPLQFVLSDKDGNLVYGYCVDLETGANMGHYYNVDNLDDSDYYASEDAKNHIRAIVTNGYWGTGNTVDEDGNYKTGSLAKIKQGVANAFTAGTLTDEDITLEDGSKVKLSELMNDLTEGEALSVTQAAVWTFANGNANVLDGTASAVVVGENGFSDYYDGSLTASQSARVNALYNYLINLTIEETVETVVIDKDSVTDMSITVGDKVDEVEAEDDEGNKVVNGIYDVAMNFTLAFIPGENDDLLVQLEYTDLDGKKVTVTKRLAGENEAGTDYETIKPADDGSYTISGLKLSENQEFEFDLRLEGTQHLDQGVYVYSPVGGRETSQTFVGMAEGERAVDVSASMTVSFSVDEEKNVVAQRVWRDEGDPVTEHTPAEPTEPSTEPTEPVEEVKHEDDAPRVYRLNNGGNNNVETIPDEEVPLAENAITGDESGILIAMVTIAAFGLIVMFFNDKKRKAEEI